MSRTLDQLTDLEMEVVDQWIEFKDPHGLWEFEARPKDGLVPVEYEIFYVMGSGPINYMYIAESFDEMMDGLDVNGLRGEIKLKDMSVVNVKLWERPL